MSSDGMGLGGDGADWLLAQLAGGDVSRRDVQPPPVAPPAPPAQPVAPAAPPALRTPAPRREEMLDWFSEAPAPQPDAATRELPVVGSPVPPTPAPQATPAAAAAPGAPGEPGAPGAPAASAPAWTPPFAVSRPQQPPAAAPVYLTAVEPPVGAPAPPAAPAVWPPASPAAQPPVAPVAAPAPAPAPAPSPSGRPAGPPGPPGPVTPTAPFALTWSADELESEDAIRAAFRSLSEPQSPSTGGHGASTAPIAPAAPAAQPVVPPTQPVAPATAATVDESPFAGFAPPPVARQSFTPVSTPSEAVAAAEPALPVHPTSPPAAPPGWGDRRPRTAAAAAPPPAEPALAEPPAAPTPAAARFDHELWAALNESEQPSAFAQPAPTAQPAPPVPPAYVAPSAYVAPAPAQAAPPAQPAAPAEPVASVEPVAPQVAPAAPRVERDRFAAFAADTTDPFAALNETRVVPVQQAAPVAPVTPVAPVVPVAPVASPEPRPFASAPAESDRRSGFPMLEVRGVADDRVNAVVSAPAREASAFNTTPFPAFASASGGGAGGDNDPTREPPAPVDDLLASLGGGGAPRGRGAVPPAAGGAAGGGGFGANPPTAPVPSGLDALGLGFDDEADDADAYDDAEQPSAFDDREAAGIRGRFFGRGAVDPEPSFDDDDDDSSIAREMAEKGYFWNLTPDPNASDPKDSPESVASALLAESGAGASEQGEEFDQAEASDEFAIDPEWAFPGQAAPARTEQFEASDDDSLSALFGASGATPATGHDPLSGQRVVNDPFASPFGGDAGGGFATAPMPGHVNGGVGPQRTGGGNVGGGSGGPGGPGGPGGSGRSGGSGGSGAGTPPAPKGSTRTRTLIWVAGGLVVLLVLVGLYYLGTMLSGGGGANEAAGGSPSASSSETPVEAPTAPQPAGVHAWNTLFGGECIEPFESVWVEEFTVVDCTTPHAAQLVYRGTLPGDEAAPFPGEAALTEQMPVLCRAAGVFDPALVAGIPDLQVQGSFPVTEEQWAEGQRSYYCFANRAGGEPLTGPINGPGPAPAA
ncbi:hypothetical protein ACWGST_13120 [Agromyces sp. NPDC055520]